jgi:uncharacterized protein YggT (Ycf19 family)
MKLIVVLICKWLFLLYGIVSLQTVTSSVFMPYTTSTTSRSTRTKYQQLQQNHHHKSNKDRIAIRNLRLISRRTEIQSNHALAMAIPGYGIAEQVLIGGFGNFLSIYNLVITARILLSWFPQAASIGALQPVYAITDPYLNLFRGIIPPLFGLDFSPILAFVLLNVLMNANAAVGIEIPTTGTNVNTNRKTNTILLSSGDSKSFSLKKVRMLSLPFGKNLSQSSSSSSSKMFTI